MEGVLNYYNEIEPYAVQWLKNLIDAGLIPAGHVDSRSIKEVMPSDLDGYTQCHFFAGIGGWSLALQLAGWPATRPVWTGSCPCQPFSDAGQHRGTDDPRHLWPDFYRLISVCKPSEIFGEQVAAAAGRVWLTGVRADMERMGYAVGGADLCAASVTAPHIRQRLYWMADAYHAGQPADRGAVREEGGDNPWRGGASGRVGDAECAGLEGYTGDVFDRGQSRWLDPTEDRPVASAGGGCWDDYVAIPCGDGKTRRIKPGIAPLAHGVPGRMGQVRAYGNAIVPQLAAEFIMAGFRERL